MRLKRIEEEKSKLIAKVSKGILVEPESIPWDFEEEDELKSFIQDWYRKLYDFEIIESSPFEEQIFHSPFNIQINRHGAKRFDGEDFTQDDFQLALEILALKNSVEWNFTTPFASFDVNLKGNQFRATLLHYSLCKEHGSKLFLRRHAPVAFHLDSFTDDTQFLRCAIESHKNILICGGTGSGKTSLLNSMLALSNREEHLVILEDTHEILSPHENTTRLLARQGHPEDLKNFMSHAMRMSPERIVLGELRSSEAEPFLLAMNSGHKGLLSTIHANSAPDAISRIALLVRLYAQSSLDYALVTKLVCQNIDYVVHMENKRVKEIIEVFGSEGGQVFYETVSPLSLQQLATTCLVNE